MAISTTIQQLGTHALSYNSNTVYKEGRCISFLWNGDDLNIGQNTISVLIRARYYYNNNNVKTYLDNLNDPTIPVNPWVSRLITVLATPGVFINPSTTEIVEPDANGIYPSGSVDGYEYWSGLFPTVFSTIDSQVVVENTLGNL